MSCSLFNQTGQKVNLKMDIRQIDLKYKKKQYSGETISISNQLSQRGDGGFEQPV